MDDFLNEVDEPDPGPLVKDTGKLLFRLMVIAFLLPGLAAALIWLWFDLQNQEITNKQVRISCMIIWLLTMATLAVTAFSERRGSRRRSRSRKNPLRLRESLSPLDKWEQRSSRGLLFEVCGAVLGIPLVSFFMVSLYFHATENGIPAKGVKTILPILWIGGILIGFWLALRSTRQQLLYSQASRKAAERERDALSAPEFADEPEDS